ncbi:MAG: HAD family hydrolase, partial [Candidatus Thorarchaeota archaeon]
RLKIDEYFDLIIISDEIGIKKPNPELFEYWLKKFNVFGEETIYIGDRIDKDIFPANINNIHSIYLHRGGKYDRNDANIKNKGSFKPDYEIADLSELFDIINSIK